MHIGNQQANRVPINGFTPQNRKLLSSLHQNARELVNENGFQLVRLLDQDADADRVEAGFNQDFLFFISR